MRIAHDLPEEVVRAHGIRAGAPPPSGTLSGTLASAEAAARDFTDAPVHRVDPRGAFLLQRRSRSTGRSSPGRPSPAI